MNQNAKGPGANWAFASVSEFDVEQTEDNREPGAPQDKFLESSGGHYKFKTRAEGPEPVVDAANRALNTISETLPSGDRPMFIPSLGKWVFPNASKAQRSSFANAAARTEFRRRWE